jgi:hypothetical protein
VLVTSSLLLGAIIVVGRALRRYREARRARLAAPARRVLLALAAGDDEPEHLDTLVRLEPAVWRAVEPTAVAMLGKVRGEAHASLVTVFERRGMGGRALRDVTARGAVRRARAAEVLGNLGRRDAVPSLVRLLAEADPDVRMVAARALGRIAEPDAATPLLESLAGRRPVPPQTVAHALMRMGAAAQHALTAALDHHAQHAQRGERAGQGGGPEPDPAAGRGPGGRPAGYASTCRSRRRWTRRPRCWAGSSAPTW